MCVCVWITRWQRDGEREGRGRERERERERERKRDRDRETERDGRVLRHDLRHQESGEIPSGPDQAVD